MKPDKPLETLLNHQIVRIAGALDASLDNAEAARAARHVEGLSRELNHATALANALSRLGDALARVRGQTQTIRVEREGASSSKRGSNGQANR